MPMGIVSEDEFVREQNSLERIVVPSVVIVDINRGRGENVTEVPGEARKIIGEVGIIDRQGAIALAASLGISPSSASAYSNGAASTTNYREGNKSLKEFISRKKDRIVKKATSRLMDALDNIDNDRLANAKLSEISGVARDMSVIIKNMEPEKTNDDKGKQQNNFVIFAPMVRSEDKFETIYSRE